jgi:hypothetical protein
VGYAFSGRQRDTRSTATCVELGDVFNLKEAHPGSAAHHHAAGTGLLLAAGTETLLPELNLRPPDLSRVPVGRSNVGVRGANAADREGG